MQDTRGVSSVDPNSNGAEFSFAGGFRFPVEKISFQINSVTGVLSPWTYLQLRVQGHYLAAPVKNIPFFSFATVIV